MLSAFRVLDLTEPRCHLAGQILAGLGAEVIAVEPPEGSPARFVGPFHGDERDPERSLLHWAYNRGKKSVVLELGSDAGVADLRRLALGADILLETAGPTVLDARGLSGAELAAANPGLIHVTITPFGSDGPRADWAFTDLTVLAAGGQLSLTGDDDRAPVRVSLPQAFHHASAEAAQATLIALYERQHRSGLGQHVDVSAQQAVLQATQSMMLAHPLEATHLGRMAGGVKLAGLHIRLFWPCADGYVSVTFLFGAAIGPFTQNLMNWVHEEGFCDEAMRDKNWIDYTMMLFDGREPIEEYERAKDILTAFFATKTKAELFDAALSRRLLIAPVTDSRDVLDSPQYAARDFFEDVDHGELGTVRYPGAVAKFSASPLQPLARAPHLGEHTVEVLAEPVRTPDVPAGTDRASDAPPLEGLKVLDLMWVMAGPAGSRVLADYGATVIRVESVNRIDTARTLQPFWRDDPDPEYSGLFNNMNAGKLGLALDLRKEAAREVVLELARWADVVTESFSPKAMRQLGLDYAALREVNPDVIMLSSCLLGQTGPYAGLAGFGTMAAAISGFFNIAGWPDRPPCGPFGAYTDYVSPRFLVATLMAALEHRRATGQGQYIDLSQAEASAPFLSTSLLDCAVNGRVFERQGNTDPVMFPHGVFPAAGEDRWVALAVEDADQWRRLCAAIGRTDMAELVDAADRRRRAAEIDAELAAWTGGFEAEAAATALQEVGVPAYVVQNTVECFEDPQLRHRGHFVEVEHEKQGTTWVEGTRFHLSRTPARITRGAPTFGQHTFDVLTEVLGYDGDRIAELAAAELLE